MRTVDDCLTAALTGRITGYGANSSGERASVCRCICVGQSCFIQSCSNGIK